MALTKDIHLAIRRSLQQKAWARTVFSMSDAHSLIPDFLYENLKLEAGEDDLVVVDDIGGVHYISVGTIDLKRKDPNMPGEDKKA